MPEAMHRAAPPSLASVALAAVARCLPAGEAAAAAQPLLRARAALAERWDEHGAGAVAAALLLTTTPADLGWAELAFAYGLHPVETLALNLAAAVEDDVAIGRALALLQGGAARPTLGLIDRALRSSGEPLPSTRLIAGAATRAGLLLRDHPELPLAEQPVRLALPVLLALRGGETPPLGAYADAVAAPSAWIATAARFAALIGDGGTLLIRGGDREERSLAAALVAAALGRRALVADAADWRQAGLAPWCRLRRAVAAMPLAAGGDRWTPPPGLASPLLVLAEHGAGSDVASTAVWTLAMPEADERAALWQAALGVPLPAAHALRCAPARIARLAAAVAAQARLAGRSTAEAADLTAALAVADPGLGGLATPVPTAVDAAVLVLPPAVQAEFDALLCRCRHREGLGRGLGGSFAARMPCGVRALLVGPPGTGKSLGAAWLAGQLGLPMQRVDLAAVASKYIGETEQNLGRLLDVAEAADVVLLFDEADALFANRTEVRDASDRHANAVVNYLLSRLEGHAGIVLLTANSRSRFDAAFARRLDAVIEVPLPGPEERRALWRCHLGSGHALPAHALNRLAAGADLAGGHIRNSVLAAALRAQAGGHCIGWDDVVAALGSEYRKLGRSMPADLRGQG